MKVTRSDIYARVHKGLRKALFDLAYESGRADLSVATEWDALKSRAAEVFHFLDRHGAVEDNFQLPLLEAKIPGVSRQDSEEHEEVHRRIHELEEQIAAIDHMAPEDRTAEQDNLYLAINRFVGDYLTHMNREEVKMAPLFMEHCAEEELGGMLKSIIASNAPNDVMMMLRYTIPSIDPVERAGFLGGIRAAAPPPAFQAMMGVVRGVLAENEWERLQADLAVPADGPVAG